MFLFYPSPSRIPLLLVTWHWLTWWGMFSVFLIKPQSLTPHPRVSELWLPPPPARACTLYYSCFFFSCSFLPFPSPSPWIFTSALMAMTFVVLHPPELGFCSVVREERRVSIECSHPPSLAALPCPHLCTWRDTFSGLSPILSMSTLWAPSRIHGEKPWRKCSIPQFLRLYWGPSASSLGRSALASI